MRVALVGSHYLPYIGGIEEHMAQLAKGLTGLGVEVSVVCLQDTSPSRGRRSDNVLDGIPVRRIPVRRLSQSILWPARLFRPPCPDVIHFHGFSRPLMVRTIKDSRRIPLIITPHGGVHAAGTDRSWIRRQAKGLFDRLISPTLLRRAGRVICLSPVEEKHLRYRIGVHSDRVAILHSPVSNECLRTQPTTQGESGRLLVLSRLARRKRISDILAALARYQELPDCDVVGPQGDDTAKLHRMTAALTPGRVRFLPPVKGIRKAKLIRSAKAVVLCSDWEGQSVTALEAIAQETPVIASDAASEGLPSGPLLTFPLGDIAALAGCIRSLNDPTVTNSLRHQAQRAKERIPSPEHYAHQILQMYKRVMG